MTSLILFSLATVCYTISQASMHGKIMWGHNYWGLSSYRNKYRVVDDSLVKAPKTLYYRLLGIKYQERFPLSASLLVFTTDAYHLFQLLFKAFLCTSIAFYTPIFGLWDIGVYFLLFGLVFTVTYKILS